MRWLEFQFEDDAEKFVQDIFDWIGKKDFKRGGFLVTGPANCGNINGFIHFRRPDQARSGQSLDTHLTLTTASDNL